MKKIFILILIFCSISWAENPYRILNNFNAGELSPFLLAREDLAKYQSGCSLMENMIPLPQGGAQKRPGTKYIAEVKTSSLATRIIPFEYSTTQSYIVEVGNQYMRFFTNGTVVYEAYGTEDLSDFSASLVAHWLCDDNAANTAVDNDEGTAALDGEATSNTDTITTTDAAGTANEALNFDATDYFTVADNAALSFGDGSDDSPFTFCFWGELELQTAAQLILMKQNEYNLQLNADETIEFYLKDDSTGKYLETTTDDSISAGWHFFVFTYTGQPQLNSSVGENGTKLGMRFYIDYVEIPSSITKCESGYVAMENLANIFRVGNLGVANVWEGKIDNVALFDKALTAVEVASLTGSASTTAYEVATPYLTADLFELKFEQSADVLYITHPDYETRKLLRLANAIWSLEVFGAEAGPFRGQNIDTSAKITASATTGSVTLTATGHAPFVAGTTAGHLPSGAAATSKSQTGALFKLVHPLDTLEYVGTLEDDIGAGQTEGVSWMSCGTLYKGAEWSFKTLGTWEGQVGVQRNYTIGAAVGNGADEGASVGWETVLHYTSGGEGGAGAALNVTTTGTEDYGDADYRITFLVDESGTIEPVFTTDQIEHTGIVKITAVASTTSATGTVLTTLASTDATHKWSEGGWSNYRGWPATVTFFEDRLTFGGNTSQPDTIWASVTSDYENMTAGVDDDDALIFTLSSRQVNVIEWLIGKDKILIGTSGAEWTLEGGADEPLTPSNVIAKQHSTYGSANMQATLANESVLFFQRGAEKMRELAYNWELDSYVAPDMTILANLVTDSGIDDTAFQKTPDSILWCVRGDGELPVFSYERKENITAWSRMITEDSTSDSDFESIARIHGDPEDEIWVVVERTIDSNTVRYIEQFQPRDFGNDPCDAFYVDCGATYTTDVNAITDLTWLEGESVVALADGTIITDLTVASNSVTLGGVYQQVQIGLPYTVQMRTMPLSWIAQGMTIQGRIKRINEVIVRWYISGDFSIGKDADTLETYSITGQTTSQDRKTFPPGFDRNGYVFIYQQSPEPLTLIAIMVEFQVQ